MTNASAHMKYIMLSEEEIKARVARLSEEINRDYAHLGDEPILFVGMLKGAFVFFADLVRGLNLNCEIDFMAASSYKDSTVSSGVITITRDIGDIKGKHVVIVEDIIDSGNSMSYILELLRSREPASLKLCSLLSKPSRRVTEVAIDYLGFTIEDEFVVGYGLDYARKYRHLPYIGVLKPEIYAE